MTQCTTSSGHCGWLELTGNPGWMNQKSTSGLCLELLRKSLLFNKVPYISQSVACGTIHQWNSLNKLGTFIPKWFHPSSGFICKLLPHTLYHIILTTTQTSERWGKFTRLDQDYLGFCIHVLPLPLHHLMNPLTNAYNFSRILQVFSFSPFSFLSYSLIPASFFSLILSPFPSLWERLCCFVILIFISSSEPLPCLVWAPQNLCLEG